MDILQYIKSLIGVVDPSKDKHFYGNNLDELITNCGILIRKTKRFSFNPRILKIKISARITLNSGIHVNDKWITTLNPPRDLTREEELEWLDNNHEELIRSAWDKIHENYFDSSISSPSGTIIYYP